MNQRRLVLSDPEREELEAMRDHEARPYLRERAAALLKIAGGMAPSVVAREGLHKVRHQETVFIWLNSYEATRQVRPHAARRRAFSPSRPRAAGDAGAGASVPAPVRGEQEPVDAYVAGPAVPVVARAKRDGRVAASAQVEDWLAAHAKPHHQP